MKGVHLICRMEPGSIYPKGVTPEADAPGCYVSHAWNFPISEAERLVGGMIYLHDSKAKPSRYGGEVVAVRPTKAVGVAREDRVEFIFKATLEGKNQEWRGADHDMAWTSGIIDI